MASILRQHARPEGGFYSKAELVATLRWFERNGEAESAGWDSRALMARIRRKPMRTQSGVTPVTVLTKPYACPGRCIFCPNDVRMPKSYISSEPGAQRAAEHAFDPYGQTWSRLRTLYEIGHSVDKVELIVLGGTWSFYPEPYRIWFLARCFEAMHDFGECMTAGDFDGSPSRRTVVHDPIEEKGETSAIDWRSAGEDTAGRQGYNGLLAGFTRSNPEVASELAGQTATWEELEALHRENEAAPVRSVGLVLETRPDHIDEAEVLRLRRLGATKVQIGLQSLDDRVLELNHRGHDVAASRRALSMLRAAGFKVHAHWMPNLHGSSPEADVLDYHRLFDDPAFRPDELKIYPCSLVPSAELMQYWERGEWRPWEHDELVDVLARCLEATPRYCRLTRIIRDIPSQEIAVGNKLTNLRQVAEDEARRRGLELREIRAREIRGLTVSPDDLEMKQTSFAAGCGNGKSEEIFLEAVDQEDRLAGFLRLSLPDEPVFVDELRERGRTAMVREVHVYGNLVEVGARSRGRAQHSGLGRRLMARAEEVARQAGYKNLAVISAVGTRGYYRKLGFEDGQLYQHRALSEARAGRRFSRTCHPSSAVG